MDLKQPDTELIWDDVIYEIQNLLKDKADVYIVGGAVRDAYRKHPIKDIDMIAKTKALNIARQIANAFDGDYYALDKTRGVGRALINFQGEAWTIDVSSLRGRTLDQDLYDRDFTVNAMCVPLDGDLQSIYDPMGGMEDWQQKILQRCSPESIQNDPIRAMRAVRQSLQYGLRIEPETREDIRHYAPLMTESSSIERIRDEFFALLDGNKPVSGLSALKMLGMLEIPVPEAAQYSEETWRYVLMVLDKLHVLLKVITPQRDDNIAANAEFGTFVYLLDRYRGWLKTHLAQNFPNERSYSSLLLLTAMLRYTTDDDSKSADLAKKRAVKLKLSQNECKYISDAIGLAQYPIQLHQRGDIDARQVYEFWRVAEDSGIDACLLAIADYLASAGFQLNTPEWTRFLQMIGQLFEGYDSAMHVEMVVDGNILMKETGIKPGAQLGQLLAVIREMQALGEINTAEEALDFAHDWLNGETN